MTEVEANVLFSLLTAATLLGWLWWMLYTPSGRKGLVRVVRQLVPPWHGKYTYHYRSNIFSYWSYSGKYYDTQSEASFAADDALKKLLPKKRPKTFEVVER